jgi:N-acetylneuraminate synthase
MQTVARAFPDLDVGYSDHTIGPVACLCAAAMGARVLEKHFTWDRDAEGPDHRLSADPTELKFIVDGVRQFERMRGHGEKRPAASEAKTRLNNRKSVVLEKGIRVGEKLTATHIAIKRPGYGIAPKHYGEIIGRQVRRDLGVDDVLTWDDLI